jgi:hypothetical protein
MATQGPRCPHTSQKGFDLGQAEVCLVKPFLPRLAMVGSHVLLTDRCDELLLLGQPFLQINKAIGQLFRDFRQTAELLYKASHGLSAEAWGDFGSIRRGHGSHRDKRESAGWYRRKPSQPSSARPQELEGAKRN